MLWANLKQYREKWWNSMKGKKNEWKKCMLNCFSCVTWTFFPSQLLSVDVENARLAKYKFIELNLSIFHMSSSKLKLSINRLINHPIKSEKERASERITLQTIRWKIAVPKTTYYRNKTVCTVQTKKNELTASHWKGTCLLCLEKCIHIVQRKVDVQVLFHFFLFY